MKKLLFCMLSFVLVGCGNTNDISSGMIKTYDALFFDFGDALVSGGDLSKSFTFENTSKKPLTISAVNSSCGCTKGFLEIKDMTSPVFSIDNPLSAPLVVPGNTEFRVTVQYDPGYHGPEDLGPRDQLFYFVSSSAQDTSTPTRIYPLDGKSALTEIKVTGNVVASLEIEELVE